MKALAETRIVSAASELAGTSRTRVYAPRKQDPAIAEAKGGPRRSLSEYRV
jgi:hypothetical protein